MCVIIMMIDSIIERRSRYYKLFDIREDNNATSKRKGGGGGNIEKTVAMKEELFRQSMKSPGKVKATIKCSDKIDYSKLRRIMLNNMMIAKRMNCE